MGKITSKSTHKKNREAYYKIFLVFCILLVTPVLVSSLEFDNIKGDLEFGDGISKYGKIEIRDWFGILSLTELELKKNTDVCSGDCSAETEIIMHQNGALIDEVRFMVLNGEDWIEESIIDYTFYIKTGEEVIEVDDKEYQCHQGLYDSINKSYDEVCNWVKVGTLEKTKDIWEEYNLGDEVGEGTYYIKLEGEKNPFKTVDWQITSQGKLIDDWATWEGVGTLNAGLVAYYQLEEDAGTANSTIFGINLTNVTDTFPTYQVAGRVNFGYDFSASPMNNSLNGILPIGDEVRSISIWVKKDTAAGNQGFIGLGNAVAPDRSAFNLVADNSKFHFTAGGNDFDIFSVAFSDATWYNLVITYDGTTIVTYVNGTNYVNNTPAGAFVTADSLEVGGFSWTTSGDLAGDVDEIGIWNRTLTTDEVEGLYNDGNGITWAPQIPSSVTLNSPDENFISSSSNLNFNCSGEIEIPETVVNISLWTDMSGAWVLNETEDFTIGGGAKNTSIFNKNVSDSTFNWTCRAFYSDDTSAWGANRTVSIDTMAPNIHIISPVGQIDSFVFGDTLDLNWSINDTNLDPCWFQYNNVNTSVTCSDNTTEFTPVVGQQSLILYANDSVNNLGSNTTSWTYGFLEQNTSFNTRVFETASETFQLNLTTDINVLTINSFLFYNGVSDRSTASCDEFGNCTLTNILDIPLVTSADESENKTFFWALTIFNGTSSININTSIRQQNVTKIHLEECNSNFNELTLNFTSFDEQNLTRIDPFVFNGDFLTWLGTGDIKRQSNISNSSVSSEPLCLFPNATHFIDGQVTYDSTTPGVYTERNYWFQNDTISNVSQDIELGLLASGSSTSFILKVQDTNILPVPDVLIFTERFYPGLGEFKIVQVAKTDDNGGTIGFFQAETADYRFVLKQQGTIVLQTNDQKMVGESTPFTLTFTIGDPRVTAWEGFEDASQLEQSLTFNSSSNIVSFTYIDTSGEFISGNLLVEKLLSNGSSNVIVCDVTSFQSSATVICDLTNNQSGTFSAQGTITRTSTSSTIQILVQVLFGVNDFTDIAGDYGLFLGWFIILIGCFAFKFNEIAGIFMINVTVIGVNMIGLIHFGPVFITAMVALSIFIAVILER